ncbi:hypothetical protein [Cellulophaga sp. BC115SP]|uniref:hypothetical protein n=1 Tax=Cellulophaga sp. BC115SP TaxID=2683263 RepID=UPI001412971E|nr:hypothetical protein [Cellulophaga sp. BC115SP]NBB28017.1 hypothetical protein [Cellulophaga sp. BC115SP]
MKQTEKNIGFSIIQISTEQFALLPEAYQVSKPAQIQHELSFGIDKDNKRIYVKKTARFHHVGNNYPFIIIAVSCQFQVNPDDWSMLEEAHKIVLPQNFGIHLGMLVVGTLRGVLYTKTENTIFNQFILPTIDVTALVPNDVTFE